MISRVDYAESRSAGRPAAARQMGSRAALGARPIAGDTAGAKETAARLEALQPTFDPMDYATQRPQDLEAKLTEFLRIYRER